MLLIQKGGRERGEEGRVNTDIYWAGGKWSPSSSPLHTEELYCYVTEGWIFRLPKKSFFWEGKEKEIFPRLLLANQ